MNEQTDKLIQELANKMGTTAEHLWSVLVRQAAIDGWACLVLNSLLLAGMVGFWLLFWRHTRKLDKYDRGEVPVFYVIFAPFTILLLFIPVLNTINTILPCLLNPEYWALKQILK